MASNTAAGKVTWRLAVILSGSPAVVREVGGERLGGMYGTAGATAPDNPVSAAWEAAFVAEYGQLPAFAYVKEPTTRRSRWLWRHRQPAAHVVR